MYIMKYKVTIDINPNNLTLGGKEMAIRNIRQNGDEALRKKCKVVTEITPRTLKLIEDMADTMYEES